MLTRVQMQMKLTKAQPSFYLLKKTANSKNTFKFQDAYLMVRRVQPNPLILSAHDMALTK